MTTYQFSRRVAALTAAATVVAGASVLAAPTATAAQQTIEGATFEWRINDYIQFTGTGQGCHYLSAGAFNGTDGAAQAATYKSVDGNVKILRNGTQPSGFADKCTGGANFNAADPKPLNQKVVWSGGTGTRDDTTGAVSIAFQGVLSLKFSGPDAQRIVDPVLNIDAGGTGTLTADMLVGNDPATATTVNDVVVAEFAGVDTSDAAGLFAVPTFLGRVVTSGGIERPSAPTKEFYNPGGLGTPNWGSWPQSFVTNAGSAASRFFNTSTAETPSALDYLKDPAPIVVAYGPTEAGQVLNVDVPQQQGGGEEEFIWEIDGDGSVTMGAAQQNIDHWRFGGAIDPIKVTDTRTGGQTWTVSGQVSDFSDGTNTLSGKYVGWTPKIAPAGFATAGSLVPSGWWSGNGLSVPRVLATSLPGQTGVEGTLDADLDIRVPLNSPPGELLATVTLTAIS